MRLRLSAVVALFALALSACGGGGGGGGTVTPPVPQPSSAPTARPPVATPTPVAATPSPPPTVTPKPTPSAVPTATPKPTPTPVGATPSPTPAPTPQPTATPVPPPTATPPPPTSTPAPPPPTATPAPPPPTATPPATPTPAPMQTYYPADPQSVIGSTYAKIGLAQIFDYYPNDGTSMSTAEIDQDASRYNFVWGSFNPQPWRQSNPSALVSRYYIIEEDNELISGHNLAWWQANHPDWILYACDSSGNPTHDLAYTPGESFQDVALNFENPSVVQYQLQNLISYAQANGYTTLALDEVILDDFMWGGNKNYGQTPNSTEFACGTWNNDGTFNKIYSGRSDPKFAQDVLNWVSQARNAANQAGLTIAVNHPAGNPSDGNEQALMGLSQVMLDEGGFSDYGTHPPFASPGYYQQAYAYLEAVQSRGVAAVDIDRFNNDGSTVTPAHMDYAIATYELANEGNLDLFVIPGVYSGVGYGAENYHQEYGTVLGPPCTAAQPAGGSLYYRRFASGLVVINAGSTSPESFSLPTNHNYADIEGRPISNPLSIAPEDGYVLAANGNGCT